MVAMQIIVNHLTRMRPGYMCVAGIDVASKRHIRPVLKRRLTTDLLTLNGGLFDIAWGLPMVGTESRNRKIAQKSHGWPLSTNGPPKTTLRN